MTKAEEQSIQQMMSEYDAQVPIFRDFMSGCEWLIAELLRLEGIAVHSVHARIKDRAKLQGKLDREGKGYRFLKDVTDVVGVRIITHFEDEVDKIGALIGREFVIDTDHSVDKRKLLDPDRFGYLSLHYICSLSPDRIRLAENRRFHGLVCEIQIRSILQHSWAEIEHDLGYKSGHGIPAPIRRRFSRLAGLLEMADEEFTAIRNDLSDYELKIRAEITTSPAEVGIDNITLRAIFKENQVVRALDSEFIGAANATVDEDNEGLLTVLSKGLPYVGIKAIQQLLELLQAHRDLLLFYAGTKIKNLNVESLARGAIALNLMGALLALEGEDRVLSGLTALGLLDRRGNKNAAREWVETIRIFNEIQKERAATRR